MEETIAAIATPLGVGAISIIRVSGNNAIEIVNKIFKGKDLNKVESHTINYGYIVEDGNIIDEVLLSVMKAPRTYTREDIIEINSHGGIATTNKILELLLQNGCVPAQPGEFTKRAFLNGRIDLEEAEGIMNIIEAKTEPALKLSINQLSGKVSEKIKLLREDIVKILANIEVNIDYPEYEDIEEMTYEMLIPKISEMKIKINKILDDSKSGKIITEGIKTSIIGRPNVGKSSILNKLLEQEKAIVTDIAGTTRDIVEGEISLDGILLNIIDTAGIRSTDDIVEKIGVEKSLSMIDDADLVVVVLNNNEELTAEDQEILEKTKAKERIIVINKNDLSKKLDISRYNLKNVVETNANTTDGIKNLKEKMIELFQLETIKTKDYTYLTNARQIALAKKAYQSLTEAEAGINNDLPIDMVEIDLKNTFDFLGEIIGETYSEEILDHLFANFCVGK